MERKQFTFYRSFYDAVMEMDNDADRLALLLAIIEYSLLEKPPKLKGPLKVAFTLVKPTLDTAREKSKQGMNRNKNKDSPSSSSSSTSSSTSSSSSGNYSKSKNKKETYIEKETYTEIEGEEEKEYKSNASAPAPNAPSLPEVVAFFKDKNLNGDPNEFFYYYQGRGWEGVKDWTGYAYNWSIKERKFNDDDGSNDPIILGGTRFPAGVTPQTVSGDGKFKLI